MVWCPHSGGVRLQEVSVSGGLTVQTNCDLVKYVTDGQFNVSRAQVLLTCFDTFSQVFLSLKMELLIKAELISNTELKLCKLRQTSPTVAHFSITVARADGDWRLRISDATSELVCRGKITVKTNTPKDVPILCAIDFTSIQVQGRFVSY